jgi:hypothetical protein
MFFRQKPAKPVFDDYLKSCRAAGFNVEPNSAPGGGRVQISRDGFAALVVNDGDVPRLLERAGPLMTSKGGKTEIGRLVDGGFQKFFQTPSGARKPALASQLKELHEFEEDLREALGLVSLYNESLGSVSTLYLYDRVKDRDSSRPKKPWELKIRGGESAVQK